MVHLSGLKRREAALDIYKLGIGLLLFVSPWLFAFAHQMARIDSWVIGAGLMAISLMTLVVFGVWEEWLLLALGFWLLVSPWALGFLHTPGMHVSIFVGIAVIYLAGLEIFLIHEGRSSGKSSSADLPKAA